MSVKRGLSLVSLLLFSSCDTAVRIETRLKGPSATEAEKCVLRLHGTSDGRVIRTRRAIGIEFSDSITISPFPQEYFVTIDCDGFEEYKSKTYKMPPVAFSSREDRVIDLGSVEVARKPAIGLKGSVPIPPTSGH